MIAMLPPLAASGDTWPMERPDVPPETSVGDQRTGFTKAHRFQEGGWVEHLLHATAFRPFVTDDHHVAFHNFAADGVYRLVGFRTLWPGR